MINFTVPLIVAAALRGSVAETPRRIEVPSALIKLIEQVDVPAREAGMLAEVKVSEGQAVEAGDPLAQITDTEARLAKVRAATEVAIAKKNAENDVNIRFAEKSEELAKTELRRALDSVKRYPRSISASEIDHLRLTAERASLEVEQAARDFEVAAFAQQIKENEYEIAVEKVERRKIVAPLAGVVVQINRHRGEWVEPGDAVLRILRIDRLRAEGFVSANDVVRDLTGCPVTLTVDIPGRRGAEFSGKVVFLSPEIDPVNAQLRVWAEIENRGLQLRPGMRAKLSIERRPPGVEQKP